MDEYYVNWNQALSGSSDLTIKGSVNFTGARVDDRMQGVTLGKLTIENTGGNDLRVTSAFSGGLTLADGKRFKSSIDPNQCAGCGLCPQVCKFDAIKKIR